MRERTFKDRLSQQEKSFTSRLSKLDAKLDQVGVEFQSLLTSLADLSARLQRLEQRLEDLDNAVRLVQAPTPPPPSATPSQEQ